MAAHPSSRHSSSPAKTSIADVVCPRRFATLSAAVELQVDPEDLSFESSAERALWEELQEEFRAFVAKVGPVWIAD